jgi:O-antigen ligase
VALPLYAFLQAVALPLPLVEALSPERVELQLAVATLSTDVTAWIPVSVDSGRTLTFAARLTAHAAVFWIARGLCLRLGRYALAVAAPIVAVAAAEAAISLYQGNTGGASGSYVNRNHLAGLLEMALPFAVVAVVGRTRWIGRSPRQLAFSGLAGGCALLIVAGILATRSRAGLLAVIASLAVMGLIVVGRGISGKRQRLTGAVLLPVLMVAAFAYLPSDGLVRRYGALAGSDSLAGEGRLALWGETLDLVAAYPLLGCGFGAYEPAFLRYKRSAPMVNDRHSHNDYLEALAEGGVIGFVICIVVAAGPAAAAIRASRRPRSVSSGALALACVGSLTAILAHSLVDFNLRIPANGMVFFWLLGVCSTCRDRPAPWAKIER